MSIQRRHSLGTAVLISGDRFLRVMLATSEGPEYELEGKLAKKHNNPPKDGMGHDGLKPVYTNSLPDSSGICHLMKEII